MQTNPTMSLVERIRLWITQNIDYDQLNQKKPVTFHKGICLFDCQLPSQEQMALAVWMAYKRLVLDQDMMSELEGDKVLNWSQSTVKLFPFKVPRDGNCLLHSVSFAMWGVDDEQHTLRNLVKIALDHDHSDRFRSRWWRHRMAGLQGLESGTSETITREWHDVVSTIANQGRSHSRPSVAIPHQFLESIHIYVLANVLRRPIIILANPRAHSLHGLSLQENNLYGVYLPLEWTPSECGKSPIILGFSFQCSHFCPLLTTYQAGGQKSPILIPLATQDLVPLPLRCLKESEEPRGWQLFQDYLIVKEVNVSDPREHSRLVQCCSMSLKPMAFDVNTVEQHYQAFSTEYNQRLATELRQVDQRPSITAGQLTAPASAISSLNSYQTSQVQRAADAHMQCVTPGCQNRGHRANNGLCTACLRNYTIAESGTQLLSTKDGDRKVYIPIRMADQTLKKETLEQPPVPPQGHAEMNLSPTAPPASNNFESAREVTSMMSQRCVTPGCGYRCSKQTYPYCHECSNGRHVLNQSVQAVDTENMNAQFHTECKTTTITSTSEEVAPTNFQTTSQFGNIISFPSLGSSPSDPFQATMGMQNPPVAVPPASLENKTSEGVSLVGLALGVDPALTNQCEGPECTAMVPATKHLCKECEGILREYRSKQNANIPVSFTSFSLGSTVPQTGHGKPCLIQGCPNFGDPAHSDMCSSCFLRSENRQPSKYDDSRTTQRKANSESENPSSSTNQSQLFRTADLNSRLLSGLGSILPFQETKVLNEEYHTVRTSSPHSFLSQMAASGSRAPQALPPQQTVLKLQSPKPASPPALPQAPRSSPSNNISYSGEFTQLLHQVDREAHLGRKRCQAAGCDHFGNSAKMGFCNACYRLYKLQEEEMVRAQWGEDVVDTPRAPALSHSPLVMALNTSEIRNSET